MDVKGADGMRKVVVMMMLLLAYGALTAQPLGTAIDPRCFDMCKKLCEIFYGIGKCPRLYTCLLRRCGAIYLGPQPRFASPPLQIDP
ncbi:hypothetical protein CRG98_009211 [Punica granatum]|uniref:Uncharacterized protein n=1 Tax=Punica granatum TaxID=22663 RepID=A0A2I0KPH7_PUNGR|nr:hypothetical protein CRG98_009211 [Punica granatum]